ncbi:MAG: DNA mismatch repair endonuclease MutL, partial [Cyanobacteria bacterium J06632_22]
MASSREIVGDSDSSGRDHDNPRLFGDSSDYDPDNDSLATDCDRTAPQPISVSDPTASLDIQPLAAEIVNRIAAGEVIDALAAAVRELAENALDANATRIHISLWPQQWRLRVADNGTGMDRDNLVQAATAHSTSKIRSRSDLDQVATLGFRGEALHSLAQLADLTIASRLGDEAHGWQATYGRDGHCQAVVETAIAPGTVVTADHLFVHWPSRQAALTPQVRAVQQAVQQLALCHPTVTWQVDQDGQTWFSLWPGASARTLMPQLLRSVTESDLREVAQVFSSAGLKLVLGLPDRCHRRRPDWVRVAVNGRMVQAPALTQSLIQAFRRTLPRDRYPVCFLHLQVSPSQVDWNRTPAKSEIYIDGTEQWCDRIITAVQSALQFEPDSVASTAHDRRTQQLVKAAEQSGTYGAKAHTSDLPSQLTAVAQVSNTYIVAEHSGGICLIEQHIAHERVLYERLKLHWQIVPIATPIILERLRLSQVKQLERIGLDIAPFGEQLWAVRTVPAPLVDRDDCPDALLELSLGGELDTALVATACRTAIRNGTVLQPAEMQTLLDDWQRTQNPRTCPHGRPI